MPLMTWNDSLDIGVDKMNHEHQQILDAMNRIYDSTAEGAPGSRVLVQIELLEQVTVRHFRDEEAYMKSIGYPDFENHQRIHHRLIRDLETHVAETRAAGGIPTRQFFDFLRLWLSAHIKNIDRKYADYATK
jgi:hemerythrin